MWAFLPRKKQCIHYGIQVNKSISPAIENMIRWNWDKMITNEGSPCADINQSLSTGREAGLFSAVSVYIFKRIIPGHIAGGAVRGAAIKPCHVYLEGVASRLRDSVGFEEAAAERSVCSVVNV